MSIFPICYFPPIPWFALAIFEKEIFLEIHQYYRKQQLTNRTYIKTANGTLPLIIPVGRKGKTTHIWEKSASRTHRWKEIHWRSIYHAYRNSAYFAYYEDSFRSFFETSTKELVELLIDSINISCKCIGTSLILHKTKSYLDTEEFDRDYREEFSNKNREIAVWFNPIPYYQVFGDFKPGLSILDLIFNIGPESRELLLNSINEEVYKNVFNKNLLNQRKK